MKESRVKTGEYKIENSEICSANQWTGFYMIKTSVMKESRVKTGEYKIENSEIPQLQIILKVKF